MRLSRKHIVFFLLLLVATLSYLSDQKNDQVPGQIGPELAFEQKLTKIQVQGKGTVTVLLADDLKGSRHQKFIVRVSPAQTILISHNIDIAPRINGLRKGDHIAFAGEYVWNSKGGLVHWTHHDPRGKSPGGWLEHGGTIFR